MFQVITPSNIADSNYAFFQGFTLSDVVPTPTPTPTYSPGGSYEEDRSAGDLNVVVFIGCAVALMCCCMIGLAVFCVQVSNPFNPLFVCQSACSYACVNSLTEFRLSSFCSFTLCRLLWHDEP